MQIFTNIKIRFTKISRIIVEGCFISGKLNVNKVNFPAHIYFLTIVDMIAVKYLLEIPFKKGTHQNCIVS
jgi:hypothetical protein